MQLHIIINKLLVHYQIFIQESGLGFHRSVQVGFQKWIYSFKKWWEVLTQTCLPFSKDSDLTSKWNNHYNCQNNTLWSDWWDSIKRDTKSQDSFLYSELIKFIIENVGIWFLSKIPWLLKDSWIMISYEKHFWVKLYNYVPLLLICG